MTYLDAIDPVAIAIGPLKVHWYGLMYLAGFLAAWFLGHRRIAAGRLPGVDAAGFSDLLFYAMVGVIVGGRLGYLLFYGLSTWIADPLLVLRVWEGGMSFHGGLIGVLAACALWATRHRQHVFDVVDFMAPLTPIGLGFGRIGNFIGGELWGKFTHSHWGVIFPHAPELAFWPLAQVKQAYANGQLWEFARHPSQLYEASLEGVALFAILWSVSHRPQPRYLVSGLFALGYGVFRFLMEFVRVPDNDTYLAFHWVTRGQLLSAPMILLGVGLLVIARRSQRSQIV